jgi:hypothetical protein
MVYVRIIDEDGEKCDLDELTDIGLGEVIFQCKQIIEEAEELHFAIHD